MRANEQFLNKPRDFWASVKFINQKVGYSKGDTILVPSIDRMAIEFRSQFGNLTPISSKFDALVHDLDCYFKWRAAQLEGHVQHLLMNVDEAKTLFERERSRQEYSCPFPLNKQKHEKSGYAYLTCLVNMIIEQNLSGRHCDFDPRELTMATRDGLPLRTFSRRVDGAFPSVTDPKAIWEIKEYYHTTTFGSRVAGGVYETVLDGFEIEELKTNEGVDIKHYLIVDSHFTWWGQGRSYLCRMFDMLHMGQVDEVIFGREVVTELPRIVRSWQ